MIQTPVIEYSVDAVSGFLVGARPSLFVATIRNRDPGLRHSSRVRHLYPDAVNGEFLRVIPVGENRASRGADEER